MACSSTDQSPDGLKSKITALKYLSVVNITIGVITMNFGILTVCLMIGNHSYPFSSGSGIYTGAVMIVLGVFGFIYPNEAMAPRSPKRVKAYMIVFRIFSSLGLDVGAVHFAFGIWSLVLCEQNSAQCAGGYHAAIFLTAGINLCFGFTILVVAIATMVVGWKVASGIGCMFKVKANNTDLTTVNGETKNV